MSQKNCAARLRNLLDKRYAYALHAKNRIVFTKLLLACLIVVVFACCECSGRAGGLAVRV